MQQLNKNSVLNVLGYVFGVILLIVAVGSLAISIIKHNAEMKKSRCFYYVLRTLLKIKNDLRHNKALKSFLSSYLDIWTTKKTLK